MSKEKKSNVKSEEIELDQEESLNEEKDDKTNLNNKDNELLEKIKKLEKDLESKTNVLLRTAAEYDNYRKRTEKEKTMIYSDATVFAVSAILPIADSLERAMQSIDTADEEYRKGFELIQNQLLDSFKTLGVESFGKKGDKFDPDIHNAVSHIENDDLEENVVSEVFQKGYRISDKIVRYAMVQAAN